MKTADQTFHEAPEAAATSASAILAFLLGITGIPAIIIGHIALARIKNSRRRLNGKILAILGIVGGWLSMITMAVIAALLAVGIVMIPQNIASSNEVKNENALTTATALQASLEKYYAETGSYPINSDEPTTSDSELMVLLTEKNYFENQEAQFDWLGMPVNGLEYRDEKVSLYDPWGKPYYIKLDKNDPDNVKTTVWSAGKDRIDGTADDILLAN